MKVDLFEKVCLSLLGLVGLGFPVFAVLFLVLGIHPAISAVLAAVIGIGFGNWAWISFEHETR